MVSPVSITSFMLSLNLMAGVEILFAEAELLFTAWQASTDRRGWGQS